MKQEAPIEKETKTGSTLDLKIEIKNEDIALRIPFLRLVSIKLHKSHL